MIQQIKLSEQCSNPFVTIIQSHIRISLPPAFLSVSSIFQALYIKINITYSFLPNPDWFTTYCIFLVSLSFSQAVITKHHRVGDLDNKNALPHNSGSWKSKNMFSTCLASTETSFIDLIMVNFLMNSNTVYIYTHMHYFSKGHDTKYSHDQGHSGSQSKHRHFEKNNPINNNFQNFLITLKLFNFFLYKTFPYFQIGIFSRLFFKLTRHFLELSCDCKTNLEAINIQQLTNQEFLL